METEWKSDVTGSEWKFNWPDFAICTAIALSLGMGAAPAKADGVLAEFVSYGESSYGYGVDGNDTMSLWDTNGMCIGEKNHEYRVTDKAGRVKDSGCWYFDQGAGAIILEGKGSIPGYLFRPTDYAREQHERNK